MDERRDWIAAWCRRLVHVADAERRCLRPLAPTTLAMLFRAEERA
jgi:hypothetical protein